MVRREPDDAIHRVMEEDEIGFNTPTKSGGPEGHGLRQFYKIPTLRSYKDSRAGTVQTRNLQREIGRIRGGSAPLGSK
jgi:hypothetical protein